MPVTKTLWVAALDAGYTNLLFLLYAANKDEAKEKVASLELENGSRCISLQRFPYGFRVIRLELPGTIEVPDEPGKE